MNRILGKDVNRISLKFSHNIYTHIFTLKLTRHTAITDTTTEGKKFSPRLIIVSSLILQSNIFSLSLMTFYYNYANRFFHKQIFKQSLTLINDS